MGFYIRIAAYLALAALGYDFYMSYRKTTGTVWEKLLGAGKASATILQARVAAIGGIALNGIVDLSDIIGNPSLKAMIDQYINAPAVGWTMVGMAVVAEYTRRRTLLTPVIGTPVVAPVQSFVSAASPTEK